MPLYRCTSATDALEDHQRSAIAKAITAIHCDLTGAPPTFVHVQFHEAKPGAATPFVLHGGIRAGRAPELTEELIRRCCTSVAGIAAVDVADVTMRTSETPASWILEGGHVLPEPGEEEAWLAAHA